MKYILLSDDIIRINFDKNYIICFGTNYCWVDITNSAYLESWPTLQSGDIDDLIRNWINSFLYREELESLVKYKYSESEKKQVSLFKLLFKSLC